MNTFWKPIRKIKLNNIKTHIPKSKKQLTYPQATQRYPRLSPFGDEDKDSILNMFDCRPFNPKKHTTITFKNKKIKVETPKEVKPIVDVLNKKGRAYVVGGFVRDTLLERPPKDVDIEVHGMTPEKIAKTLKSKGYTVNEVGKSFGVLKVSPKTGSRKDAIDVSVPRADSTGRKPRVTLLKNPTPKEAAQRRDFTINAIMYDTKEDKVVDPYGGVQDLDKGKIKAVSDKAFSEDPLRVVRAAQFASRFNFDISPETVKAAKKANLKELSGERIREEFEKVSAKAQKPSKFFEAMDEMGQLSTVFPEVHALKGVQQDPIHHPEGDAYVHTMQVIDRIAESKERNPNLLLAGVLHDIGKAKTSEINPKTGKIATIGHEEESAKMAREFMNRLKYPNEEKHEVVTLVEYHMEPHHLAIAEATKLKHKNRLLAKVAGGYNKLASNPEKAIVRYKSILTLAKKDNPDKAHLDAYDKLEDIPPIDKYKQKVKGEDLIAQGYAGKQIGKRLNDLYLNQIAHLEEEKEPQKKSLTESESLILKNLNWYGTSMSPEEYEKKKEGLLKIAKKTKGQEWYDYKHLTEKEDAMQLRKDYPERAKIIDEAFDAYERRIKKEGEAGKTVIGQLSPEVGEKLMELIKTRKELIKDAEPTELAESTEPAELDAELEEKEIYEPAGKGDYTQEIESEEEYKPSEFEPGTYSPEDFAEKKEEEE